MMAHANARPLIVLLSGLLCGSLAAMQFHHLIG
jgi:hypothetical protein